MQNLVNSTREKKNLNDEFTKKLKKYENEISDRANINEKYKSEINTMQKKIFLLEKVGNNLKHDKELLEEKLKKKNVVSIFKNEDFYFEKKDVCNKKNQIFNIQQLYNFEVKYNKIKSDFIICNNQFEINSKKKIYNFQIRNFEHFIQGIIKPIINNNNNNNENNNDKNNNNENNNENNEIKKENINEIQIKQPLILIKEYTEEFTLKSKYKKSNITTIQKLNNINLLSLPKKKGKLINLKTIEITILKEKKNETKEKENLLITQTSELEIINRINNKTNNNNNINKKILSPKKKDNNRKRRKEKNNKKRR